jgi:hypothetical protein
MSDHNGTEDAGGTLPQEEPAESPAEAIDRLAGELDGVQRRTAGHSIEFVRGSLVFAVQTGTKVEFRLRPEIAAAGLRTPGAAASGRGTDWISLDTTTRDQFTVDRTVSWFEMGWRIAGESADRPKPH